MKIRSKNDLDHYALFTIQIESIAYYKLTVFTAYYCKQHVFINVTNNVVVFVYSFHLLAFILFTWSGDINIHSTGYELP